LVAFTSCLLLFNDEPENQRPIWGIADRFYPGAGERDETALDRA
jgi:hypothetical protein